MAKKKTVKKTKASAQKPVKKKAATAKKAAAKKAPARKKTVAQAAPRKKTAARKPAAKKPAAKPAAPRKKAARKVVKVKKKGVRRATTTTGINAKKNTEKKLGRSRIPTDAPLDIIFQNDQLARESFVYLGIHTVRELEMFEADELVMRLTSPAKQTVGRIRKILAMNKRCLAGDEGFALEFLERSSQTEMR